MRRVVAAVSALVSAFFVFYVVRLLVVTGLLRHVRAGGRGAYIGAGVFPRIAVACAWAAVRLWRGGPSVRSPTA